MNVIEAMQSAVAALDPHDYHDIITNLRAAIAELEKAEDTYPVDSELVWYKNFEDLKESSQKVIDMLRKELGIVIEARDSDKRQANGYFVENSRLNTLCVNLETQLAAMTKERDALRTDLAFDRAEYKRLLNDVEKQLAAYERFNKGE